MLKTRISIIVCKALDRLLRTDIPKKHQVDTATLTARVLDKLDSYVELIKDAEDNYTFDLLRQEVTLIDVK